MRTRKEQAIDMAVAIEGFEKPSELLVKLMREELNEAEQRGYERARAECAADTRRLEWLSKGGRGLDSYTGIGTYVATEGGEIFVNEDIRVAIDAARKVG